MGKSHREKNQKLIMTIYEAAALDDEAKAAVIAKGVQLHKSRKKMLKDYDSFIQGFTQLYENRNKKPKEVFPQLQELAKSTPIPDYNPADDFGIMNAICEAAVNKDFKAMYLQAVKAHLPIGQAVEEGRSYRRAAEIMHYFRNITTDKNKHTALKILRRYKGTLTNTRDKGGKKGQ